jgi:hypothetical protein
MANLLFEDRNGYERPPLTLLTPNACLIWTEKRDRQIYYYQSIVFYLCDAAIKEIFLFAYPGDG